MSTREQRFAFGVLDLIRKGGPTNRALFLESLAAVVLHCWDEAVLDYLRHDYSDEDDDPLLYHVVVLAEWLVQQGPKQPASRRETQ